jgi:uncharacterized membrane protein YgcG
MKHPASLILIVFCLFQATSSLADERILQYDSHVTIHPGGELTVIENIRVRAEGKNIRRGIYRDFPTRYKDRYGNHFKVDFSVDSVMRDGTSESWHTKQLSNGTRVYVGSSNHTLSSGIYTYEIRFRTNRQLGFYDTEDELWWNVTGNDWSFPIDAASARISFPVTIPATEFKLTGYVGVYGSTETSVRSSVIDSRTVEFQSARPLKPGEGLSVVVNWPKGLIREPSTGQKLRWFARDNGAAIVLLLGFLLPLAWYYRSWNKVGRDPEKAVIIPRFQPPDGLSAAACRYVQDMSFDRNAFTAAIISLAIKGHITIEEEDKEFTLRRPRNDSKNGEKSELTPGESGVLETLLPHTPSSISMKNENHKDFQEARSALKKALKKEYLGRLFHLNSLYLAPPIIISVLFALVALAFDGGPAVWIIWGVLSLLMHGLFIWLLRAPTPAGRLVMDEIEGFKMYLDTAEQERLDQMRSPTLTPEVFESFLPYAYALGVENHWCERFTRELPEELRRQSGYQPSWYSGQYRSMNALNHLGDNFSSSFSSAISSASSPPGSSSGGGGGGFSGGGGGGGGGGGW